MSPFPPGGDSSAPSSVSSWTSGAPSWWSSALQYPPSLAAQPPPRMRPSTPPSPTLPSHLMLPSTTTPVRLSQLHASPPTIRSPTPPSPPPLRIRPPSSPSPPPMPRIRSPSPPASVVSTSHQPSQIPRFLFSIRSSSSPAGASSIPSSSSSSNNNSVSPPKTPRAYNWSYSGNNGGCVGGARPRTTGSFAARVCEDPPPRRPSRQTSFSTVPEHCNQGEYITPIKLLYSLHCTGIAASTRYIAHSLNNCDAFLCLIVTHSCA